MQAVREECDALIARYEREKVLLAEELRLNEAIQKQQQGQIAKLLSELKEVKQVLKVPRMHFKYLEQMGYDQLVEQRKEIEARTASTSPTNVTTERPFKSQALLIRRRAAASVRSRPVSKTPQEDQTLSNDWVG